MTDMLQIDGSDGEGGGQIVRSSLALALVTGRSVTIENIRAGREKPGLMRQHLTAVKAAVEVCGGSVTGAEIGSLKLTFEPRTVQGGKYNLSIGTAGSATLVLQTVLPALLIVDEPSELVLEGGTHNQWAPPYDFLEHAFLPLVTRMGPQVSAKLERHGFYPAGGGKFTVTIQPCKRLQPFDLLNRGEIVSRVVRSVASNLPIHVARREVERVLEKMNWSQECGHHASVDAHGPGNVITVKLQGEHVTELFTAFGRVGASAEKVADEVIRQVRDYLVADAPVGIYLADQLMLPLGISIWQARKAGEELSSSFRTMPLTRHSTTHIEILRKFLNIDIRVDQQDNSSVITLGN